jgi:hypothetical protein
MSPEKQAFNDITMWLMIGLVAVVLVLYLLRKWQPKCEDPSEKIRRKLNERNLPRAKVVR